ncbi:MAG: FtsX-like permease family protein [Cytophagia bacterium]|nr:MAG: FtsX-like permease family protein [Cytophagales bacterium]TAG38800.1 MAG: FtsX-like permease family protein [Cytophagia bacterium]
MFKNYLKIALRNLIKNKAFSFINITGLSIGLACCVLIFLYTKDELSFDRFHQKKDNLHLVTCKIIEKKGVERTLGITAMTQGPSFKSEIPEIEEFVRVQRNNYIVKKGTQTFDEKVMTVDDNFFSVFSFPLIEGSPQTVLKDINSIVLTDEMATKYFGKEDPIGKILELQMNEKFVPFTVSGIAKNSPQNSSIQFKMLISFNYEMAQNKDDNWLWLSYPTYLVLNPKANLKAVAAKMNQVYNNKASKEIEEEKKHGFDATFIYGLQPFESMHLNTDLQEVSKASNPMYSYILSGIALFILLIACINFVNLTVAQSLRRGKEIGVRKVVGGDRKQLIIQFLGESFFICLIAFTFGLFLAQLALPFFNELANKRLELNYLFDYKLVAGYTALFLLTVFTAGFYPSIVLSGFDPLKTLYNRFAHSGKNYLSKGLVVLQFSLATFMIIATFFIYKQFNFMTNKDLGYNDKNLMVVDTGYENSKLAQTFKDEFSKIVGVQSLALRQQGSWGTRAKSNGRDLSVEFDHIDENYLPTLQLKLAAGRNFSRDFPSDFTNSVLVNETYVKEAGWKDNGVGKTIDFFNGQVTKLQIVGVVKDYHYGTVKQKIQPEVFTAQPDKPYSRFLIKINPENKTKTIAAIEAAYHKILPYRPFSYDFMEDLNFKNYEEEAKWKQIVTFGAILMIFIACIGLFGLTMLSIQQRTKEIGVRKVLGASIFQISSLVAKNFVGLVLIAFLFAIPAAWYAINKWLENFAYPIDISWQVFALATLLTTLIALLTVSYQAIKAALMNPVESLKTE